MNNGLTIKDATERWVHEMNAIPTGMIEKMMEADIDDWREVTLPSIGDQVYADSYGLGEVAEVISTEDGVVLVVDLDVHGVNRWKFLRMRLRLSVSNYSRCGVQCGRLATPQMIGGLKRTTESKSCRSAGLEFMNQMSLDISSA